MNTSGLTNNIMLSASGPGLSSLRRQSLKSPCTWSPQHRCSWFSGDDSETSFLFQQWSVLVQRFNGVLFTRCDY